MAPAARASQPDYIGVTVYVAEDVWRQLRREATEATDYTASSICAALMEHYVNSGLENSAGSVRGRAREITLGRRKRSD